jgi:hypothetical protein
MRIFHSEFSQDMTIYLKLSVGFGCLLLQKGETNRWDMSPLAMNQTLKTR